MQNPSSTKFKGVFQNFGYQMLISAAIFLFLWTAFIIFIGDYRFARGYPSGHWLTIVGKGFPWILFHMFVKGYLVSTIAILSLEYFLSNSNSKKKFLIRFFMYLIYSALAIATDRALGFSVPAAVNHIQITIFFVFTGGILGSSLYTIFLYVSNSLKK
jgi:hypothetical protein